MLIRAAWTEGEAAERNITVSQAEIDEQAETDLGLSTRQASSSSRASASSRPASRTRPSNKPPRASRRTRSRPTSPPTRAWTPRSDSVRVLETRSRARARQALKAISTRPDLDERRQALRPRPQRTIVKSATARPASSSASSKRRRPRPPATAPPSSGSRRSRHGAPRHADVQRAQAWEILSSEAQRQAVEAFDAELRAKWRPRTTCAPAVHDPPGLRQPPNRRVIATAPQPEAQGRKLVHPPKFG